MARNPAAQTAVGPMVLAAVEQHEDPARRLVDDDLAATFLPTGVRALAYAARWSPVRRLLIGMTERSGPGLWANLTCRKQFIDDRLDVALPDIDAVVILGAGLDTRGCRLARRSEVPVFEVDLPVNIARKAATVRRVFGEPPQSVRLVPFDFERDNLAAELARHGHHSALRTFYIWEGVTQYLTAAAVRVTLDHLSTAPAGSRLALTYVRRDFIDGDNLYGARPLYRRFRDPRPIWKFGILPEEAPGLLADYGWRLVENAGPDHLLERYVRPAGRALTASQIEWTAYARKD